MTTPQNLKRTSGHWSWVICFLSVISAWALGSARADSVFLGNREINDAVIQNLAADALVYQANGRIHESPASKITRISVKGEPPLNDAELAYASADWHRAVDHYQKAIRTTSKSWVKQWAALRMLEAANKAARFDAAASAYIMLLQDNPAAAASTRPVMPDRRSSFLDTAVAQTNDALNNPQLTTRQRHALLKFLMELHQARKDRAAEETTAQKLAGLSEDDLGQTRQLAERRLSEVIQAFQSKNYQQALALIESSRPIFVEPAHQAEALFLLAEARSALADSDPTALKDAALAYMRVVTFAQDLPGRPHVDDSLQKTADIMEKLGEPQTAARLRQQVTLNN